MRLKSMNRSPIHVCPHAAAVVDSCSLLQSYVSAIKTMSFRFIFPFIHLQLHSSSYSFSVSPPTLYLDIVSSRVCPEAVLVLEKRFRNEF